MLEKLKPIKTTPTGIYFRMADGRIGYANHQYARVSVTREGIRNGEYYKEDNEIGDRLYQINKKINYPHHEIPSINMVGRVRYNDISEAINALQNFNNKNCGEYAVELRKNKILKQYEEHKALNIRSVLTRYKEPQPNLEAYNRGHDAGRKSVLTKNDEFHGDLHCKSYNQGHDDGRENGYDDGYNAGFSDGVASIEDKLNKLLNNL